MQIEVTKQQFPDNELITLEGQDLKEVYLKFGELMAEQSREKFSEVQSGLNQTENTFHTSLQTQQALSKLVQLADQGVFTINGINWLQRYLDAFYSFCQGAGLQPAQGALLQAEVQPECQTMLVKDSYTKEIRFIHTEEDSSYTPSEFSPSPFRLVEMIVAGKKITFFAYPGLSGWGPAFGLNHHTGLIQMVDDLYVKTEFNAGPLWVNAMSFMTLDSGDLSVIHQLLDRGKSAQGGFWGAYALHFVIASETPMMAAVEFAHDTVSWEEPYVTQDRSVFVHANCPIQNSLQKYCESGVPQTQVPWSDDDNFVFVEMRLRHQRLQAKAVGLDWLGQDPQRSIDTGLQTIASPEGDVGGFTDSEGKDHYQFLTGLPSKWTVGHMVGYVGPHAALVTIGKNVPPQLPGKEYALSITDEYPYAQRKIWKEAARFKKAFDHHLPIHAPNWQQKVIYPFKLYPGAEVRIISPSMSLSTLDAYVCRQAQKRLEALGLKITYSEHAYEEDMFESSSVSSRVADLHQAFLDPNVKAIICGDGGFNSNQMLNFIDWELIRSHPKIFTGYSDITALQNAILAKAGLVTYSGALFWSIGIDNRYEYTKNYLEKCLFGTKVFDLHPSHMWEDDNGDEGVHAKSWVGKNFVSVTEGEAVGRIVGGNLSTFGLLRGTEFFPNLENTILFLEDDHEYQIWHFDRDLQSLLHQPGFFGVRAIVFGRFEAGSHVHPDQAIAMFKSKPELQGIPIIANVDFGHTYPKVTFPIGGTAYIKSDKEHTTIRILEH